MHIRAGANPDSLQTWMLDHLVVCIIDLNSSVLVFVSSPLELGGFTAAYCDDTGARYAVKKGSYMAFAHAPKASDRDVDLDALL
jgi:hypothetical protein